MGCCNKDIHVHFDMCGCHSDCNCGCGEVQPPEEKPEEGQECKCVQPGVLNLKIGTNEELKTLREAITYIKEKNYNLIRISLSSDIKETGNGRISIDRHNGYPSIFIIGNGHSLDLSEITDDLAITTYHLHMRIMNLTILAPNSKTSILSPHSNSDMHLGNCTIIGGGASKGQKGIMVQSGSKLLMTNGGSTIKDCATGIYGFSNSLATVTEAATFTNVTTPFSPARDTLGNKNSFIAVNY